MTTSTPLFCRAAPLRRHATGGTLPRSGHWSIGLLRASAGLLSRVLFRTTATTARAYLPARVGTRRSHPPSTLSRTPTGEGSFRPETFSPNELATGLSPFDPLSISASATLGPGTMVVNIGTGQTILVPQVSTRPILGAVGILASDSHRYRLQMRCTGSDAVNRRRIVSSGRASAI